MYCSVSVADFLFLFTVPEFALSITFERSQSRTFAVELTVIVYLLLLIKAI